MSIVCLKICSFNIPTSFISFRHTSFKASFKKLTRLSHPYSELVNGAQGKSLVLQEFCT